MNIKNLFSKPEKFTNYEPKSPAERAARKWDEREGEIIVQNYNLRRLLVGMLTVVMILTVGLVYKSLSSNVMPYIVEVDTMTGAIRNVGTVEASKNYQVGEAVYKYFLSKFLKKYARNSARPSGIQRKFNNIVRIFDERCGDEVADNVEK